MAGTPHRSAPFVGRIEELAALDDAYDAAADGLVVALVGGDPGVGKTALARAFARDVGGRGASVHWGPCVEIGGAPAFWPWLQVLRSIGDEAFEAVREGLAARADEPFPAYAAVHEVLRQQSRDERLVLVLDDLHRADLPSLELLRFLTTAAAELPILVVGTHRLHELRNDRPRDVVLAAVAGAGRRILPASLDLADVRALLAGRAAQDPDPGVAVEVLSRSGGNALFVEQLVDAVGRGGPEGLAELPDGIRAAVRARLEPLTDETRRVLAAASVLGPGFRPEVLGAVLELPVATVRAALAPAVAIGVLGSNGNVLAFTHALIRDTLDDELDGDTRSRCHLRAASALAARSDEVPAAVIAQHLLEAGGQAEPAEVARWADRAAVGARRLSGHREAARWAEVAARHWDQAGDPDEAGRLLVLAIGDRITVGDGPAAVALSTELIELARRTGSGRLLAAAALTRAEVFDPTVDFDVPPLVREALAHPDLSDQVELRADLLGGLASILGMPSIDGFRRDGAGALAAIAELRDLAATGNERARGQLAAACLNHFSGPLHRADRVAWLAEREALLPAGPNVLGRMQHLYWAASLAFEVGDLFEVDRVLREWELLADRSDSTFWTWRASMARASLTYARGRLAQAEEQAVSRADLVSTLHPAMAMRVVAGLVFNIRRDQGRLLEVAGLEDTRLGVLNVLVAAERGDEAGTRRLLAAAVASAGSTGPDDLNWLCLLSLVATAAAASGDVERCTWAADELDPYIDQCVMWGRSYVFGMPVAEAVGIARRGAGDLTAAAEAFRFALEWADRVGAAGFGARARVGLASVLAPEDPERLVLASDAWALAARLGLAVVEAEASAILAAAPAGTAALVERPDESTPASTKAAKAVNEASPVAVSARVRTLGRFEVVGAGQVAAAHWTSRKARDALKVLICGRGRAVAREELIDHLWPDVDLVTGRSRLSVVLSMLRSALDPDKRLGADPLRSDRQSVALDLDLVSVDVEELLAHAAKGLRVGTLAEPDADELRLAAALADQGPFLSEDPYADFAATLRATVERTQRDVIRALARLGQAAGDDEEAAGWWARLVDLDPDDLAASTALLAVLEGAGRHGEAQDHRSAQARRHGR